jgi:hypothetical protein
MTSALKSWEEYVTASAGALNLVIEPAWKTAIAANLQTVFKIAASVDEFELPEDIEPAAIFEA